MAPRGALGEAGREPAGYLTKGKQIYVEGRLQTRQWDDKDGNKRYTTEINADRITLLGGGGGGGGGRWTGAARQRQAAAGRAADGADHRRRYSVLGGYQLPVAQLSGKPRASFSLSTTGN